MRSSRSRGMNGGPGGSSPEARSAEDQAASVPRPKRSARGGALRGRKK